MTLRADQWLMIAVGGGLAYVVWRLATNPANQPQSTELELEPGTTVPALPPGVLPTRASFGALNAIGRGFSPGVMPLRRGQRYRGRLELGIPAPVDQPLSRLSIAANQADVASELVRFGLHEPTVLTEAEVRRTDMMPLEQALERPDPRGGSRWFEAVWRGDPRVLPVPERITLLFPTTETARLRALSPYTPLFG